MQTEVSILHHDYPSQLRELVDEKLQGLRKFYDRVHTMRAMIERQREEHRVELVANVGRGSVLVVDARGDAFQAALDEAADRMGRLLKRHNQKLGHDRRRAGREAR